MMGQDRKCSDRTVAAVALGKSTTASPRSFKSVPVGCRARSAPDFLSFAFCCVAHNTMQTTVCSPSYWVMLVWFLLLFFLQTYGSAIKQERDRAVAQNTLSMKRLQAEKHLYVTEVRVTVLDLGSSNNY